MIWRTVTTSRRPVLSPSGHGMDRRLQLRKWDDPVPSWLAANRLLGRDAEAALGALPQSAGTPDDALDRDLEVFERTRALLEEALPRDSSLGNPRAPRIRSPDDSGWNSVVGNAGVVPEISQRRRPRFRTCPPPGPPRRISPASAAAQANNACRNKRSKKAPEAPAVDVTTESTKAASASRPASSMTVGTRTETVTNRSRG